MEFPPYQPGNIVDFNFQDMSKWSGLSSAVPVGARIAHTVKVEDIAFTPARPGSNLQVRLEVYDDATGALVNNGTHRITDENGVATVLTSTSKTVKGRKYRIYVTYLNVDDGIHYGLGNEYHTFIAR